MKHKQPWHIYSIRLSFFFLKKSSWFERKIRREISTRCFKLYLHDLLPVLSRITFVIINSTPWHSVPNSVQPDEMVVLSRMPTKHTKRTRFSKWKMIKIPTMRTSIRIHTGPCEPRELHLLLLLQSEECLIVPQRRPFANYVQTSGSSKNPRLFPPRERLKDSPDPAHMVWKKLPDTPAQWNKTKKTDCIYSKT